MLGIVKAAHRRTQRLLLQGRDACGDIVGQRLHERDVTLNHVRAVANRIRAGCVYLNGASFDRSLPFGGYKQSGNGREFGVFGFEEYLEVKAILGQ